MTSIDLDALHDYVSSHPDATLHELGEEFNVSYQTIWRNLKATGYVFKKRN